MSVYDLPKYDCLLLNQNVNKYHKQISRKCVEATNALFYFSLFRWFGMLLHFKSKKKLQIQ